MSESNKCCEKCSTLDGYKVGENCYQKLCPCHSTTPDIEWARELGWKHKEACADGRSCICEIGYIHSLLTSRDTYWKEQLQNARIDWLRSEIEKLKDKYGWLADHGEGIAKNNGYNEALDDILSLLSTPKDKEI